MELQRIDNKNFDAAWELMLASFPPFEMRTRQAQLAIGSHANFCPDIIIDNNAFAGILFHWNFANICYVEHFATLPSLRGQGVGAKALTMLIDKHPLTILEIDPPIDEISIRRKGFYERVGFVANHFDYTHIGYPPQFTAHQLVIMSYPKLITPQEFDQFKNFNYNTICQF